TLQRRLGHWITHRPGPWRIFLRTVRVDAAFADLGGGRDRHRLCPRLGPETGEAWRSRLSKNKPRRLRRVLRAFVAIRCLMPARVLPPLLATNRVDQLIQPRDLDRLHEMAVEARGGGLLTVCLLTVTGERQQPQMTQAWNLAQMDRQLIAIHARQTDIEKGDVGFELSGCA